MSKENFKDFVFWNEIDLDVLTILNMELEEKRKVYNELREEFENKLEAEGLKYHSAYSFDEAKIINYLTSKHSDDICIIQDIPIEEAVGYKYEDINDFNDQHPSNGNWVVDENEIIKYDETFIDNE
jgi:hypothetical protein